MVSSAPAYVQFKHINMWAKTVRIPTHAADLQTLNRRVIST